MARHHNIKFMLLMLMLLDILI